jgi:hypothetical protein
LGESGRNGGEIMGELRDYTVIYYTANYLDEQNPYFLANTRKQLVKAIGDLPVVCVSQKPTEKFEGIDGEYTNLCVGDIGRSHLNIYWQILQGCKLAKTKWVIMAEDDILYSESHFNFHFFVKDEFMNGEYFLYDMNKVSLFTWTKPPMFSFRTKRKVVNQLIAPRKMLIDSMEERFKKVEELRKLGWVEDKIIKYWGDPGRYEDILGVTIRKTYEFYSWVPSIVFSHEYAYGYEFNQGKKKKLGDLRIIELADWGKASDILKLYKNV